MKFFLMALMVILAISMSQHLCNAQDSIGAAEQKVVPASDILFKISKGIAVDYDNITIEGDVSPKDDLPTIERKIKGENYRSKLIDSPIRITNSIIQGTFELKDSTLIVPINMNNTIFLNEADFTNSRFCSTADFSGAHFTKAAMVAFSEFEKGANFNKADFGSITTFDNVVFNGNAFFQDASFLGQSMMNDIEFRGEAFFRDASFSGDVNMRGSNFLSRGYFDGAAFMKEANFDYVVFDKYTGFENAEFKGDASFNSTLFVKNKTTGGLARFTDAHFIEDADFYNATFFNKTSFVRTYFDKTVGFEDAEFKEGVSFNDSRFSHMRIGWDALDGQLAYDGPTYLAMIKNFKDMEQFEDADDCYYVYRSESQSRKGIGLSWIYDFMAWITCGYGVQPMWIVGWVIIMISFFTILYKNGSGIKKKDAAGRVDNSSKLFYDESLYLSTMVFTGQKPDDMQAQGRYKYAIIAERIMGWFFMALFLVVLGRMMIR
jgi:hypothetical protein